MMTRTCEESAKWVTEIQLRDDNVPGILEPVAYHNNGDPSPSPNSATRSGRSPVSRSKTSTSTTPAMQDAPPHDPASTVTENPVTATEQRIRDEPPSAAAARNPWSSLEAGRETGQ